ncbi:MAG: pseudaminic acid biosynthesis-associated methylase [Rhodospirillaceae bacterium]|nr:pseudaminic acid biosynthesis-associated methylase [Rhodospirillaceae bacterium]
MNKRYRTEQEEFWAGDFGDQYSLRNSGMEQKQAREHLLSRALKSIDTFDTAIEFGANVGLNLLALQKLFPRTLLTAVEINLSAVTKLKAMDNIKVIHGSILSDHVDCSYDLAFVIGVLIHIDPEFLPLVYDNIYTASKRYILIGEYYSSKPTTVSYRGHENRLFKRDFAGELLDKFEDLSLVDYGFFYHRDPEVPLDDITWFLMEKSL